jgi:hypothetical protein
MFKEGYGYRRDMDMLYRVARMYVQSSSVPQSTKCPHESVEGISWPHREAEEREGDALQLETTESEVDGVLEPLSDPLETLSDRKLETRDEDEYFRDCLLWRSLDRLLFIIPGMMVCRLQTTQIGDLKISERKEKPSTTIGR